MHFFSARRQKRGFTLIEFMMVLALGGIVAAYQIQAQIQEIREVNVVHMANHINHFQRQSLQYYRDNSNWPINAAKLVSTGYINSNKDYYGDTYAVANNVAKNEFTVTMNTRELYYPSMLARL
jgi:prepilin-type N-terminal cleavage/methylation domain-containing protein